MPLLSGAPPAPGTLVLPSVAAVLGCPALFVLIRAWGIPTARVPANSPDGISPRSGLRTGQLCKRRDFVDSSYRRGDLVGERRTFQGTALSCTNVCRLVSPDLTLRQCSRRRAMRSTGTCASPIARRVKVLVTLCSSPTGSLRGSSGTTVPSRVGRSDDIDRATRSSSTSRARECPIRSRRARCRRWSSGPTASPQCWTISGVAKRSSLAVDGAFATAALFAATYPSRTTALVVLEGYADPKVVRTDIDPEEVIAAPMSPCGARGKSNARSIRTCRGTRRSGQRGRDKNAWRRAQGPLRSMMPLVSELDVRAVLPTIRVPTLVRPPHRRPEDPARVGQERR